MIAIDPKGERTFVTPADLEGPEEHRVEWRIRDMTQRQRVAFMNSVKIQDDGAGGTSIGGQGTRIHTALKGGLVGYTDARPLKDASGAVVPFKRDGGGAVADEFLERIPWTEQVAISDAIVESLALDQDDVEK